MVVLLACNSMSSILKSFYSSPLGHVERDIDPARHSPPLGGSFRLALLGLGYATPYLDTLREGTERTIAFMPARQGIIAWPRASLSAVSLVEGTDLPLRDQVVDRVLLVHALENPR